MHAWFSNYLAFELFVDCDPRGTCGLFLASRPNTLAALRRITPNKVAILKHHLIARCQGRYRGRSVAGSTREEKAMTGLPHHRACVFLIALLLEWTAAG